MNFTILSKSLAAAAAVATPFCLGIATPASAAKPPGVPPCHVGSLAYPTIQSAVDDALCESINVPAGTFHENVVIRRDVEIRGAGPATTIVNGVEGPVFTVTSPTLPNGQLVASYSVTLKGMTITGGKPAVSPMWNNCTGGGGGIDSAQSTVTVKDVVITGNEKRFLWCLGGNPQRLQPIRAGHGAGINAFRSVLVVKNTIISDNVGDRCGGVRIARPDNLTEPPSVAMVADSIIVGNEGDGTPPPAPLPPAAEGQGGGICVDTNGSFTLTNSVVSGNSAEKYGGGVWLYGSPGPSGSGTLVLRDSAVIDNTAAIAGGGIFGTGVLVVKDSAIAGNTPDDVAP